MDEIIGIDLGTTNSMAALASEQGIEIIEDKQLSSWQFSAVYSTNGEFFVGKDAFIKGAADPENVFYSFKPLTGKKYQQLTQTEINSYPFLIKEGKQGEILLGKQGFLPEQLSAEILKKIKHISQLIIKQKIQKIVITVPAYFDDVQRQATQKAAELANLEVIRIINEPTAAAIAYGLDNKKNAKFVVYDFGGGTFDISILELKGKIFKVLATHGNCKLGGDDLDQILIKKILTTYSIEGKITPLQKNYLKKKAETIKIYLSNHLEHQTKIQLNKKSLDFKITRQEFNQLIEPLIEKTIDHTKLALKDAQLSPAKIDDVILVGGSTNVVLVREKIKKLFAQEPYLRIDPDKVVALGASIQASLLAGKRRDFLLIDVVPLSLGIETLDGVFSKLILKNSSIPTKSIETFSTQKDKQTAIAINIYQGERELVKDCRFLGQAHLRGLPPMPAGLPQIEVEFLVDTNGLLKVSAKEIRSGQNVQIDVIPEQGLTKKQIEEIVESSIINAEEDFLASRLKEFSFQAESIINSLDKSWELAQNFFNTQQLDKVINQRNLLRQLIKSKDPLKIKQEADKLGEITTEFANFVVEMRLKNQSF